jgi:hypothetical protein
VLSRGRGLALLVKNFRDKGDGTKDIEENEHKAVPPMGMPSIDGTKVRLICAIYLRFFRL